MLIKNSSSSNSCSITKFQLPLFGLIILPYLVIAFVTRLNWRLFWDEHIYTQASESLLSGGSPFALNACVPGIVIWSFLWKLVGNNLAVFRLSVLFFSFISIYLFYNISKRFNSINPLRYAFVIAFLPQFFIYSFQMNGLVLGICFALIVIKLYLDTTIETDKKMDFAMWLQTGSICIFSLLACTTNPFLLAYPAIIIILETQRIFKERKIRFFDSRIAIACILGISLWFVSAFIFGGGFGSISQRGGGGPEVNPRVFVFYIGHLTMLLMYLGGMFPFLVFSFKKRINLKLFIAMSLIAIPLALNFFPFGGRYNVFFHSQFLHVIDLMVQKLHLPTFAIKSAVIPLILLGLYNLVNIFYSAEKNTQFFLSAGALSLYVFLILLNPYISSRLLVPGMLGLLFLIVKVFEQKPVILNFQMLYQVFLTALYSGILYYKDGFFRV